MIIVGVDPGLASMGYGVIEVNGNRYGHICHGVVRTHADVSTGTRLLTLKNRLREILARESPDEAAVETLYFGRNAVSALPVAQARGVILCTLAEQGIPCFEYNPRSIKQAVVGTGGAEKTQIQEMVRIILNLPDVPRPDHAADALAVAFCHSTGSRLTHLESRGVQ